MKFLNKRGWTLFLAAAAVVGTAWTAGCDGGKTPVTPGGGTDSTGVGTDPKDSTPSTDPNTFVDERDGQKYRWVKIGEQTWMAQNLNFKTETGSWCYDNADSNCVKYGRLYSWDTAMEICPAGWKLPSREDWDELGATVGGKRIDTGWRDVAKKLKSTDGWKDYNGTSGNGTDDFGFSALPGGHSGSGGNNFGEMGYTAYWWTVTEVDITFAYSEYVADSSDNMYEMRLTAKSSEISIRCVKK
jgi:uncharacterized protein (TIGR02145 family)